MIHVWPTDQWVKMETFKNTDEVWEIEAENKTGTIEITQDVWTVLAQNGTSEDPMKWMPPRVGFTRNPERWGGRPPDGRLDELLTELASDLVNFDRVRRINQLARMDRGIADLVAQTDADTQRDIIRWLVPVVYKHAGLAGFDWLRMGIRAVQRGDPLPPDFPDETEAYRRITADPQCPKSHGPRRLGPIQ